MKKVWVSFFLFALVYTTGIEQNHKPASASASLDPDFGSLPLTFIPNRGQVSEQARFYARTSAYTIWLTKTGLVFDSRGRTAAPPAPASREVTRLVFANANFDPVLIAQEPSPGVVNYFLGNDPKRWTTGLPTSRAVLYRGLYPNIDLRIYGRKDAVEYDWIVNPGGRVGDIRFRIEGGEQPAPDKDGNLVLAARQGSWTHRRPVAYQVADGRRTEVPAEFRPLGDGGFGLSVPSYDATRPLMIDPVIVPQFSTFLGGGKNDGGCALAVSASGNVFVAGYTSSSDFPTKAGYSSDLAGSQDIFVTKFTASGKDLLYSTFIGGKGADAAYGIALNGSTAYITGYTASSDFPVRNAYQKSSGGSWDAFVVRIHSSGGVLEYSTYLGGQGADSGQGIAVDADGNAYITGFTSSSNFPLASALDSKIGGQDAFVAKLSPSGASLVYSTFLGGSGQDKGLGIALDSQGEAFVAGSTTSKDFPVANAFDKTYGGQGDGFVARLSSTGRSLRYSTYLGGAKADTANAVAVGASGAAYVTGQTASPDFPVKHAYDGVLGGSTDAFAAKLSSSGKTLGYSTFLGGSKDEAGQGIAVSADGTASLTGFTKSRDFPCLAGPDNTFNGATDVFLTKLTSSGSKIVNSTYLGGAKTDIGSAVALDGNKNTYLTGTTGSFDFPLKTAYDTTQNGGDDAFVAKFLEAEMVIRDVRIRYLGMPDEVDVYGYNMGDHQGAKRLLCDGVPVSLDKTLWWSNTSLTFWTSGWLYPAIYWDHIYAFAIQEGTTIISNTLSKRFLIHIDQVTPDNGATGATIDIYGWTFGATQGSNVLKLGSYTFSIVSWGNTHIQATVPAAPAATYNIYIQRGSDVISDTYAFTHN